MVDDRKLMGSAQRRTVNAVLQHGSLILQRRFDQQHCAAIADYIQLDIDLCLPELADRIAAGSATQQASLTQAECLLAGELRKKYDGHEWMRRR